MPFLPTSVICHEGGTEQGVQGGLYVCYIYIAQALGQAAALFIPTAAEVKAFSCRANFHRKCSHYIVRRRRAGKQQDTAADHRMPSKPSSFYGTLQRL